MMSPQGALMVAHVQRDEMIRQIEQARLARTLRAGRKATRRFRKVAGRTSRLRFSRS